MRMGNYSLSGLVGMEMRHKVVGVVGTGAIGVQAARILKVSARGRGPSGRGGLSHLTSPRRS